MPRQNSRAFTPLETHPAPEFQYWTFDPELEKETFVPRSMVYSTTGLGMWTKDFDLLYAQYWEENPVLEPMQLLIYRHFH